MPKRLHGVTRSPWNRGERSTTKGHNTTMTPANERFVLRFKPQAIGGRSSLWSRIVRIALNFLALVLGEGGDEGYTGTAASLVALGREIKVTPGAIAMHLRMLASIIELEQPQGRPGGTGDGKGGTSSEEGGDNA